ncbi:hypothetical protein KXD93_21610 [Mucilaginibacter sp. BJC16-A38]|uniref:hypothetical protein n=1 Tax=Mucilaginibacter phenanthrenivorans TaxID=1234842 RepID=UPI002158648A|nr:hypothetical protein [Mucilaginibacter phenanthrenivorans]MCR8560264.1 hypothetical protein [Mucilaginibacter phenanthrenivorans]
MKVIALMMVFCLVFLSAFPGRAKTIKPSAKESCCHKMSKQSPCSSKQNNDCGQGTCNTMLSCAGCGFLKVDPISVGPVFSVVKELTAISYNTGDLSGYARFNWNPPKV